MPIRRRDLLGGLGLGWLGPALPFPVARASADAPLDVAIIGAGMAGLAAARALSGRGLRLAVFEARDRIGGRLWTDRSLGVPLDLGASWIHGTTGNPITRLADDLGQPRFGWDYEDAEIVDQTGRLDLLETRLDALESALGDLAYRSARQSDGWSVQDAISALLRDRRLSGLTVSDLKALCVYLVEQEYAADVETLALAALEEGSAFRGSDAILPAGYDRLALGLSQGLDIRRGTPVEAVSHSASGVTLISGDRTFEAARVLITVPLGVLKAGTIAFSPPLPDAKRRAIEALGMGLLNKIYLRLAEPVPGLDALNVIRLSDTPRAFPFWVNLAEPTGLPVLGVLNAGSFALELEQLDNDARIAAAHEALATMLDDLPAPIAGVSTAWARDARAYGSYSYLPAGTGFSARQDLAAPVGDRLFFAGEAASATYPATVHGAFLSGQDAARALLDVLR